MQGLCLQLVGHQTWCPIRVHAPLGLFLEVTVLISISFTKGKLRPSGHIWPITFPWSFTRTLPHHTHVLVSDLWLFVCCKGRVKCAPPSWKYLRSDSLQKNLLTLATDQTARSYISSYLRQHCNTHHFYRYCWDIKSIIIVKCHSLRDHRFWRHWNVKRTVSLTMEMRCFSERYFRDILKNVNMDCLKGYFPLPINQPVCWLPMKPIITDHVMGPSELGKCWLFGICLPKGCCY